MARVTSLPLVFIALYFTSVHVSWADPEVTVENEDDAPAATENTAQAATESSDKPSAGGEGTDAESMEKAQQYLDSAAELQEKLTLLQKLLDAKGDDVDPDLKEKMNGLKASLGSLGLTMDGVQGAAGGGGAQIPDNLATTCISMAMQRAGSKRLTTIEAVGRMGNPAMKQDDLKHNEVVRMVAVCINEITEEDFNEAKAGNVKALPKALQAKAATSEGGTQVLALSDQDWKVIRSVAKKLSGAISAGKSDAGAGAASLGYLAVIPVGAAVLFLAKKFMDMTKENEDKAAAKASKKANKQK